MVARRTRRRRLGLWPGRSRPRPKPAAAAVSLGVCRRAVSAEAAEDVAARLGRRLCLQRVGHARRLSGRHSNGSTIRTTRSSSSTTARAIERATSRERTAGVRLVEVPNGGLSAARNIGLSNATGEIVAYTDADTRVDPDWLTFLVQPFLTSDVVGVWRTERRAGRRSADGAVHRPCARRADPRTARRSHRRARARLQHGVPARGAAGHRRLQSHLPARRRRCGRVLAAAGARLEDRVRRLSARLASPSRVGQGLLEAAGRLRRGREVAHGAPSRKVPGRTHAVARPHLQSAAVRPLALGRPHQRRRLGHGGLPVGVPHRRPSVRIPAALGRTGRSSRSC